MNLGAQLREFAEGVVGSVRRGRLSTIETAFLLAAIAFAGVVFYFYASQVGPRQAELSAFDGREQAARARLAAAAERKKKIEEQRNNSTSIVESLGMFERRLKDRSRGTPQIIDEIDRMARTHRVQAGDFSYKVAAAEPTPEPGAASRLNERDLQVYTALGITTTLTGDYQNLRRLIAAIEGNSTFMLINSVAFQGAADRGQSGGVVPAAVGPGGAPVAAPVAPRAPQPAANPNETAVSLKLEMETYFREPKSR